MLSKGIEVIEIIKHASLLQSDVNYSIINFFSASPGKVFLVKNSRNHNTLYSSQLMDGPNKLESLQAFPA